MKRLYKNDATQAAGRSNSTKKRSPRNWRETIEPEFWGPIEDSGEEKNFVPGLNGANEMGNTLLDLQSEAPALPAIAEHPSQAEEDFQAALFTLGQFLGKPRYSKLELSDDKRDAFVREAILPPLPEGASRVDTITHRLKDLLNAQKKSDKLNASARMKPKRGRSRPTLRYDRKRRVSPSRIFENPIQFSNLKHSYKSVEDYLERRTVALERKLGSESEDSHEEELEARIKWLRSIGCTDVLSAGQCTHCGTQLEKAETWYSTVLIRRSPEGAIASIKPVASACKECGLPSQSSQKEEEWMSTLTDVERQVYEMKEKGLIQRHIGSSLVPKKSQPQISRIWKRIEQKRTTARGIRLLKTGGA